MADSRWRMIGALTTLPALLGGQASAIGVLASPLSWLSGFANLITAPDWLTRQQADASWLREPTGLHATADYPSDKSSWQAYQDGKRAFSKRKADLETTIESLERREQNLLKRSRQIEAQLDNQWNKVVPGWPPAFGFDDKGIDAPWRTKEDVLEDEAARIERRLDHVRDQIEASKERIKENQAAYAAWKNKPLGVPYVSQWNEQGQHGGGNCGPASLAMAVNYYGGSVTKDQAVSKVRHRSTGHTDFKSEKAKSLLEDYGLQGQDVESFEDLQTHLDQGHPVILLVDNSQYIRKENDHSVPYPNTKGFQDNHIVVVTGYKKHANGEIQSIYINDPLAVKQDGNKKVADSEGGANFRIPIAEFRKAAANEGWYGSAVLPKET
jgi:uncharacterized protein YvpB